LILLSKPSESKPSEPNEQGSTGQSAAKVSQPAVSAKLPDAPAQEKLLRQTLPDAHLTVAQEAVRKAQHGRYEVRTLWTLSSADLNAYAGSAGTVGEAWPGLAQVSRIQRVVCQRDKSGLWQTVSEVGYSITSLPAKRANAAELLKRWRVHWRIEALHWVRDVTLGEDASQIHVGQIPEALSLLRNAATTLLSLSGAPSIVAGVRELQMSPPRLLTVFANLANRLQATQHSTKATPSQSPTITVQSNQRPTPRAQPATRVLH
jgi:predicted transposase YbfD/YdcC